MDDSILRGIHPRKALRYQVRLEAFQNYDPFKAQESFGYAFPIQNYSLHGRRPSTAG